MRVSDNFTCGRAARDLFLRGAGLRRSRMANSSGEFQLKLGESGQEAKTSGSFPDSSQKWGGLLAIFNRPFDDLGPNRLEPEE